MKIEIDQSGRIEYTGKPTVLAFANGSSHSIIIPSSEKQYLQRIYRKAGKSKILMIKTFSAMVFLLIRDKVKPTDCVCIDREYESYDKIIKEFICDFYAKNDRTADMPSINFSNIGKRSSAHLFAIDAYRKKKADKKINAGDILKLVL